jgi:hypothetical protein
VNTFALEIWSKEPRCCFYTVRWETSEHSETDKFFIKYKDDEKLQRHVQELAIFISSYIGYEKGALAQFFRHEGKAQGLPPSKTYQIEAISISYFEFPLRLYCLRLSNQLVILFNGGEKTSTKAQTGKTSMPFYEAQTFVKRFDEALKFGEIKLDHVNHQILSRDGKKEILL